MKVLFDVNHSFAWAHGGVQVLVENLMKSLPRLDVEVEPVRWWDASQTGDIIHIFYRPGPLLSIAKSKGYKIVGNIFLDFLSSNGRAELLAKKIFVPAFKKVFPNYGRDLGWFYGDICDSCVYPSDWERRLGAKIFGASLDRSHVILHGVDASYFTSRERKAPTSDYLICLATIHPRKNSVLLARLARELDIPILFVGKPYADDSYFKEFMSLVDDRIVMYRRDVDDEEKRQFLMQARGFVLLSLSESGCIAVLEAAAARCPLLLSDLPWATSVYGGAAQFTPLRTDHLLKANLRRFYEFSKSSNQTFTVESWDQVAGRYKEVYSRILT